MSVHALAGSFGRPFESVRRQVNALVADGWRARVPSGIVVAPEAGVREDLNALTLQLHDLMVWLVEQYGVFGIDLPPSRPGRRPSQRAVTLAAIDLVLAAIDFAALGFDSVRDFYLIECILHGSVRGVTFDPVLAYRYGRSSVAVANEHRKGVNIPRLCALLGIPPVTAYRQISKAIDQG